ncbi:MULTISPECIES: hypothetical protein [unclassified Sphingomonas]|uniref:hypothetical protein n=1 Tax=unclassified Sphingomonas TaxID=196159 RepID=UPI0006F2A545|nr:MULTISPECIES: hypothetical protein [unclassified Sphingomonas]KQM63156.1 hypothetical protein ASE65_17500 [Sphingomonas sp. Leaf16]KQN14952.1 hypothetical protein ASE81_17335 [Sphingomonas sp. Leaf29]KQN20530.1 hypothetical protein ASE83_17485 [Sphingomonas sp. Leaf32]
MNRLVPIAALVLAPAAPAPAQAPPGYDVAERTRALAFDPGRFFVERPQPAMAIRYLGDDYAMPVYAIAVRKGCVDTDDGDARLTCGQRLIARMVRAPFSGTPRRPRERGYRLIGTLARAHPDSDDALRQGLDAAGLDWVEADVRQCPKAMAQLATLPDQRFAAGIDFDRRLSEIVLHADTIRFDLDDFHLRARYEGWLKPGTAGVWADGFAASLEGCWKPATAPPPWQAPGR